MRNVQAQNLCRRPNVIKQYPTALRSYVHDIDYVSILRQNKELSKSDAQNELRWIRQAIKEDPSLTSAHGSSEPNDTLGQLVSRRAQGEPLQYVLGELFLVAKLCFSDLSTGTTDFGPLTLRVKPPVLIPRPETEHITSLLARSILGSKQTSSRPLDIVDLCTGSGCIALLLSHHLGSSATISGIDISPDAIALAKENAQLTGLNVNFQLGDLWKGINLGRKVDIVVSNPPYIPRREWDELAASVKEHEDPLALIGDPRDVPGALESKLSTPQTDEDVAEQGKGLAFYRRIAQLLPELLTSNEDLARKGWHVLPRVAVEIGYGQSRHVRQILLATSGGLIQRTEVWKDQYDVERMVVGWSR